LSDAAFETGTIGYWYNKPKLLDDSGVKVTVANKIP